MKLKVSDIKEKMENLLAEKGYKGSDIPFIVEMYLGGELRGHTSHGLASFPGFMREDFSGLPEPEVLLDTASLFMIDAKSNPGVIVGKKAADEAIKRAKSEAVGTALIKNMESWLRPGGVAQYIADQGFLAIVVNDGGGTSIAPPGGFDPTLGTNPIAYGIPTDEGSLAVDIATSKRAWGQVRLANKYGTDLPEDTYYSDQGEVTRDPKEAYSVKSFGEHKGFSLALLVEVMCGSLMGMDMMIKSTSGSNFNTKLPDRGGFILVIDPRKTTAMTSFKKENSAALSKIKNTSIRPGEDGIRIPGERAGRLQNERISNDEVEVADEVWEEITALQGK